MIRLGDIQGKCNASELRHVCVTLEELERVLGKDGLAKLIEATVVQSESGGDAAERLPHDALQDPL